MTTKRVNYDKLIPKAQIDFVVGRLHVGTPDEEVAENIRKRGQKAGWPQGAITAAVNYAVKRHRANRGVYSSVMSGRIRNPRTIEYPRIEVGIGKHHDGKYRYDVAAIVKFAPGKYDEEEGGTLYEQFVRHDRALKYAHEIAAGTARMGDYSADIVGDDGKVIATYSRRARKR